MTSVIERIDRQTPSPTDELMGRLRAAVPEYFTEGELDTERLLAMLGHMPDGKPDRYSFTWAGKRDAIRTLQTPSGGTLVPVPEESVNWDTAPHLFIEGDNLEVLKLLYKAYFGKVKLIYIDPPYNTGNDFVYPDDFADPLGRYLEITGQKDAEGNWATSNPETSGRYHSAWLSMMYPRLFLARQLLKEDGLLAVSIDDAEVHNLRLLLNEIFGEESFIANLVWQKKYGPANDAKQISQTHEHILVVARNGEDWRPTLLPRDDEQLAAFKNPDSDPRGPWRASDLSARTPSPNGMYPITIPSTGEVVYPPASRSWIVSEARFKEMLADNRIWFGSSGTTRPMVKKFLTEVKEGITPQTWWSRDFAGDNKIARYEMKDLFPENVFDTPKPVLLIERLLQIATSGAGEEIVLDFFAGSCTTAHAVLRLNANDGGHRRFIMVQLPEPTPSGVQERAPQMTTIAEIGKERIRRAGQQIKAAAVAGNGTSGEHQDFGFRVFKLAASHRRAWAGTVGATPADYVAQLSLLAEEPLAADWQPLAVVWEIALREGMPLGSTVTRAVVAGQEVFTVQDGVGNRAFYVCLESKVTAALASALELTSEDLLIVLDSALDDTAAANLALQCRLKAL